MTISRPTRSTSGHSPSNVSGRRVVRWGHFRRNNSRSNAADVIPVWQHVATESVCTGKAFPIVFAALKYSLHLSLVEQSGSKISSLPDQAMMAALRSPAPVIRRLPAHPELSYQHLKDAGIRISRR